MQVLKVELHGFYTSPTFAHIFFFSAAHKSRCMIKKKNNKNKNKTTKTLKHENQILLHTGKYRFTSDR